MMSKHIAVAVLTFAGFVPAALADAVPSCYEKKMGTTAAVATTELFVVIDQTTIFDLTLKQEIADNIKLFMTPGHAFSVMTFSAYSQGRYTQVVSEGILEQGIDAGARNDISKPVLAKFDACMKKQPMLAMQEIGGTLRNSFAGANSELAKSDVMASFKAISTKIKKSPAKNKIVLIASDMLENSSVSSFYANNGTAVRKIDPNKEMKMVADNDLLADFGGANVYVIGTALLSDDSAKSKKYRDPKTMQALALFWKMYFEKSNSTLVELGQPALLSPIR